VTASEALELTEDRRFWRTIATAGGYYYYVGFGWLVDDVWACAKAELVMGVDI